MRCDIAWTAKKKEPKEKRTSIIGIMKKGNIAFGSGGFEKSTFSCHAIVAMIAPLEIPRRNKIVACMALSAAYKERRCTGPG